MLARRDANLVRSGTYDMVRVQVDQVMHIYAMKMAAVFMSSTSAISLRTGIFPRWMAVLGFVLAILLLLSVTTIKFAPLIFPLWVLLISIYILMDNLRGSREFESSAL